MSIASGILSLYPDAKINVDFVVVDHCDGRGPRVGTWNESKLGPKPDDSVLHAAGIPIRDAARQKKQAKKDEDDAIKTIDETEIKDPILKLLVQREKRRLG